ncbi:MAG: hypothetical protein ACI31A_07670 [Candidatus Limisoma sp.]
MIKKFKTLMVAACSVALLAVVSCSGGSKVEETLAPIPVEFDQENLSAARLVIDSVTPIGEYLGTLYVTLAKPLEKKAYSEPAIDMTAKNATDGYVNDGGMCKLFSEIEEMTGKAPQNVEGEEIAIPYAAMLDRAINEKGAVKLVVEAR